MFSPGELGRTCHLDYWLSDLAVYRPTMLTRLLLSSLLRFYRDLPPSYSLPMSLRLHPLPLQFPPSYLDYLYTSDRYVILFGKETPVRDCIE